MAARRLVILSPTRNEARSVPLVMAEIADAANELSRSGWVVSLLVIDDNSTDDTAGVIEREATIRGVDAVILQGPGSGISRALATGVHHALELSPTLIATFDFDGQHDASQLPILVRAWEKSDGVAAVFGSRFVAGATSTGVRGLRRLISRCAQLTIRLATTGPRVPTDSTTSLRVFTPKLAAHFLDEVPANGLDGYRLFSWFAVFTSCRYRFAEVPIDFRPRLNGVSKLRLSDIFSFVAGLKSVRELSKDWVRQETQQELFPEYPNEYLEDLSGLRRYNQWIVDTFAASVEGRVADVGAGTGTFTGLVSAIGGVNEVVAYEPDRVRFEELVAAMASNDDVESVCGTLDEASDAAFDTVIYLNSLEHIEKLLVELRVAARVCRPGGTLVVFGPGMELIYGELDRLSGHFRRFSIERLCSAISEVGFEVIDARYADPVGALLYGVSNRLLGDATLRSGMLPFYERVVLPISKLTTPLTRRFAGKNVVVIARKIDCSLEPSI